MSLATSVWIERGEAKQTGLPWSETTITQTFFKRLAAQYPGQIALEPFSAYPEGKNGSDWAWAFLSEDGRLNQAMLVQAKKLDDHDFEYPELGHKVGRRKKGPDLRPLQVDLLLKSSVELGMPALYAFYNHLDDPTRIPPKCRSLLRGGRFPIESWGITLASAAKVRAGFDDYSFDLHRRHSMPLHCLLCTVGTGDLGPSGSPARVAAALNRLMSEDASLPGGSLDGSKFAVQPSDRLDQLFTSVLRKSEPGAREKIQFLADAHPNLAGVVVVQDGIDRTID